MTTTIDLLEEMWDDAAADFNAAMDMGNPDAADRAVMRQEIIADLIDNLKEEDE